MKPPVLLTYNLHGDRAAKIRLVAMRFRIRVRGVLAAEYDRPVGELADTAPGGSWEGEAFSDEMLVMAHFPAPLLQAFLQGMRRAGVRPAQGCTDADQCRLGLQRATRGTVQGTRSDLRGQRKRTYLRARRFVKSWLSFRATNP